MTNRQDEAGEEDEEAEKEEEEGEEEEDAVSESQIPFAFMQKQRLE